MKTILKLLFILSMFLGIISCRTTPENEKISNENFSRKKPVQVKINYIGTEFENNNPENTFISENNSWGGG